MGKAVDNISRTILWHWSRSNNNSKKAYKLRKTWHQKWSNW